MLHGEVCRRAWRAAGVALERRPFHPHLTLGAMAGQPSVRSRQVRLRDAPRSRPSRSTRVTLFQSRLSSSGPAYTRAGRVATLMSAVTVFDRPAGVSASGRCRSRCCWRGAGARAICAASAAAISARPTCCARRASRPACWWRCSTWRRARPACCWPAARPAAAVTAAAGLAAIVGHVYPVWLRFRGGKGVATACGVFAVLTPLAVGPALAVFRGRRLDHASTSRSGRCWRRWRCRRSPTRPAARRRWSARALAAARSSCSGTASNLARVLRTGTERRIGLR